MIAGVDEVGRGPLAGPVVAAAVIMPSDFTHTGLKDSKLLSAKERNYFYALIKAKALAIGVGSVDHQEIDEINILQATLKAMTVSVWKLQIRPSKLLIDGNQTLPKVNIPQEAIVKGDMLHQCIMCASIIAKVTRDRLMIQIHKQYPQYGFKSHKGYGTASHLKALAEHGPSPIHRKSFAPVKQLLER